MRSLKTLLLILGLVCLVVPSVFAQNSGQFGSGVSSSGGSSVFPLTVSGTVTSGGIPCFTSTTNEASSVVIAVNDPIVGGGAGACAKDSGIPYLQPNADTTSIAIGASALTAQSGVTLHNIAIGTSALSSLTTGNGSVAIGDGSIQGVVADQTTTNNTAIGYLSLGFPGSSGNTAVGERAGDALRSGGSDIFIGVQSEPSVNSDTNEIVIGNTVTGAGSNTATIGNASVTDVWLGSATAAAKVHATGYSTATNCSSSASPAVCGSAAAGSFVIAAAATTVTVNTTAVTANSSIIVIEDDSLGTKLSVTCNTATSVPEPNISARVNATSFSILVTVSPVTNPKCYSYFLVN